MTNVINNNNSDGNNFINQNTIVSPINIINSSHHGPADQNPTNIMNINHQNNSFGNNNLVHQIDQNNFNRHQCFNSNNLIRELNCLAFHLQNANQLLGNNNYNYHQNY